MCCGRERQEDPRTWEWRVKDEWKYLEQGENYRRNLDRMWVFEWVGWREKQGNRVIRVEFLKSQCELSKKDWRTLGVKLSTWRNCFVVERSKWVVLRFKWVAQ